MKTRALLTTLALILFAPASLAQNWGGVSVRDVGRDTEGYNWIGIEINLKDGWKTYWKHAGQNGLDPLITLSQDGEPIEAAIKWPEPKLFVADALPAIGYKSSVLVPVKFKADGKVDVNVEIGVCETVCVPVQYDYEFNAQPGYSIEQYIIQGTQEAETAEACAHSKEELAALDEKQYWLFVSGEEATIAQSVNELDEDKTSAPLAIYELHKDGIEPVPCA